MPAKIKKVSPKKSSTSIEIEDIDKIRNRINELYVIVEGIHSRIELIDNKVQKLAHRMGL